MPLYDMSQRINRNLGEQDGQIWIVNHGGHTFIFSAMSIGSNAPSGSDHRLGKVSLMSGNSPSLIRLGGKRIA